MYRKFIWSGVILIGILLIGTMGYWVIGGKQDSFVNTFYMTFITIATIGYGEIIDLSGNVGGRVFTVFIAIAGIGVLMYIMTNITALVVEGELTKSFRRRRMEKAANSYKDHYIVCGLGEVGLHVVNELCATKRHHIIIDASRINIERNLEILRDEVFIEGDATDNNTLLKAGIRRAKGLFAVTEDDNQNLVISLTAKQLSPNVRVVARCNEMRNSEKMKRAGADAVVSPGFIGGLRMASEMIRPTATSFLDTMLRDREKNLRVEEVCVPASFVGKPVSALNLKKHPHILLLAIKTGDDWIYSPSDDCTIKSENTLVFMTTPEERSELERIFYGG